MKEILNQQQKKTYTKKTNEKKTESAMKYWQLSIERKRERKEGRKKKSEREKKRNTEEEKIFVVLCNIK